MKPHARRLIRDRLKRQLYDDLNRRVYKHLSEVPLTIYFSPTGKLIQLYTVSGATVQRYNMLRTELAISAKYL